MAKNIESVQAFEQLIQESEVPVAVDFWAPWCGPCQAFGPVLEDAASRVGDRAEIVKVNVDSLPEVAKTYGITSIPTVIYFGGGRELDRATGIETAEAIVSRLEHIAPAGV